MRITCFSLTPTSSIPLDIFSWNIYDTFDDDEHLSCRFISFALTIYFSACKTTIICLVQSDILHTSVRLQLAHKRVILGVMREYHQHSLSLFSRILLLPSVMLPLPLYCSIKYLHLISPLQSPPTTATHRASHRLAFPFLEPFQYFERRTTRQFVWDAGHYF